MGTSPAAVVDSTAGAALAEQHAPGHARLQSRSRELFASTASAVAITVLVVLAFAPVLQNGFVNFDDDYNFGKNAHLREPFWPQLRWAWTTFWVGAYQPLFWMLVGLEVRVFGLNPRVFHVVSVLLHAGVVAVLFRVIVVLLDRGACDPTSAGVRARRLGAAVAAAAFAVHPLRVEAVAWATCQNYLMCSLFALLAVLAYVRAHPAGLPEQPTWRAAALGLFVVSLLAHATSLGLPLVLLALDFYPLRRLTDGPSAWRALREKWPYFLAIAIFGALGFAAKQSLHSLTGMSGLGLSARLALAGYGTCFYLVKTVLPWRLHVHYLVPPEIGLTAPTFLLATLSVVGLTLAAVKIRKSWPGAVVAWVSYLAILGPNSGLVVLSNQLAADRYSYLAMMGLFAAAGYALTLAAQRHPRLVSGLGVAILLMLGFATRSQCRTWHDSDALWTRTLRLGSPADSIAHHNLALARSEEGRHAAALNGLEQAVRLCPQDVSLRFVLGSEQFWLGQVSQAIESYQQVIRMDPDHVGARVNLAQALVAAGRPSEAIGQYRTVLKLHPDDALCRLRLGVLLARGGQFPEARAHLFEAARWAPTSPDAHLALGQVLAELGQMAQAAQHLGEAVRLRPDSADARFTLGQVLADVGRKPEAASQFRAVLRLQPNHPGARQELARTLR